MPNKNKKLSKPKKREYYDETILGLPTHVEVWYSRNDGIWFSDVIGIDSDGEKGLLDLEDETGKRRCFSLHNGNKLHAIKDAKIYQKIFGIPIHIYASDGKIERIIKPSPRAVSQFWNKVGSTLKSAATSAGHAAKDVAIKAGHVTKEAAVYAGHTIKEEAKTSLNDARVSYNKNKSLKDAQVAFARRNHLKMDQHYSGRFWIDYNHYIDVDVTNTELVKKVEKDIQGKVRTVYRPQQVIIRDIETPLGTVRKTSRSGGLLYPTRKRGW
jgi:hypothetical protein